jgi:hypothetical protein
MTGFHIESIGDFDLRGVSSVADFRTMLQLVIGNRERLQQLAREKMDRVTDVRDGSIVVPDAIPVDPDTFNVPMDNFMDSSIDAYISIPVIDFSPDMPDPFVGSTEMDTEWDMSFMYSF